jgi:carboxylate-amine ligase
VASLLTLGVEEELHLIDRESGQLAPRAPQLLSRLPAANFSAELQRTTVETNTPVCESLAELRDSIWSLRRQLVAEATELGLGVAAVGTAASSNLTDFELTASGRFGRMQEEYRQLVDEQLICGTQVHVGVDDADLAVDVTQRVSRDLPLLLALSASSPFWRGADTGYSSIRTIIWQRWPTSGTTGPLSSAADYADLVEDLIASGVIADAKMAYFDVRPSSHVPTVELRVCDACPLVDDAVLIAGLFRALVLAASQEAAAGRPIAAVAPPLHRAAMWRAARSGLTGELLDDARHPSPVPAADAVRGLLSRLRPQLEELSDWEEVADLTEASLARGNSADRQRAAWAERGLLSDVVDLVVAETQGEAPAEPPALGLTRRYAARAGDEAIQAGGQPRPVYRQLLTALDEFGPKKLAELGVARDNWTSAAGMSFGVGGEQRPFPVDPIPRIVAAHEWTALKEGLSQRARAIEAFLRDAYGPARLVEDGVLAAEVMRSSPGWRPEATLLPPDSLRAPVMGFDLVRDETGGWRVLEDNVRVPSGAGYALAIRRFMDEVLPDLPRPANLLDASSAADLLRHSLRAAAKSTGSSGALALLSDGAGNSAWFEHRLLAEQAGLLLVQPHELEVVWGARPVVRAKATGRSEPVTALYLRLDVEIADLKDRDGRDIGAQLLAVAQQGGVALANAPGNGVADDKAMYCHVPDLIAYYLSERPLLDSVPTYRCADPQELPLVIERVGELVTKPIDGYGGGGVLIGPVASAAQVQQRRNEINADPHRWVAQEVVRLSSHPTVHSELQPRHVDLRAFVYLEGLGPDQAHVADIALTRVAPAGSMVVNSSRGGGAKDTWLLGPSETADHHGTESAN